MEKDAETPERRVSPDDVAHAFADLADDRIAKALQPVLERLSRLEEALAAPKDRDAD